MCTHPAQQTKPKMAIPAGVRFIALTCIVAHVMQLIIARAPVRTVLLGSDAGYLLVPDVMSFLFAIHRVGLSLGFFWTPVTYMFLHGSWLHLALNIAGLVVLGSGVEREAGGRAMWASFLFGGIVGGIGWALANGLGSAVPCMGASAGVLALAGTYAALRPRDVFIVFLPFPVPLPAWALALGLLALNALELAFVESQVAYLAHLIGIVAGVLMGTAIKAFNNKRRRQAA